MLTLEALDVGAGSGDGTDDLGGNEATIPVAIVEEVFEVATVANDAEDEFCHFEVKKVVLDIKRLERLVALLHEDGKGTGKVLVEGETELAVFLAAAREGEGGDVGVQGMHALMLWEVVHDRGVLDGDGGFGDKRGVAVGDAKRANPGGEAAKLLHTEDEGVELHVVEGDMGVERGVGEDAVPRAASANRREKEPSQRGSERENRAGTEKDEDG